ncbi:MAG: hypothetical protein Q9159_001293 [Coniocarpon cinnabarinum]
MQRRDRFTSSSSPARPYPNFSKAHSREAVHSLEHANSSQPEMVTPESTNLGAPKSSTERDRTSPKRTPRKTQPPTRAPPSPASSVKNGDVKRESSTGSARRATADTQVSESDRKSAEHNLNRATSGGSMKRAAADAKKPKSKSKSTEHVDNPYPRAGFSASRTSLRDAEEGYSRNRDGPPTSSRPSPVSTKTSFLGGIFKEKGGLASGKKTPLNVSPVKLEGRRRTSGKSSATDSDATSVPDGRRPRRPPTLISNDGDSPPSDGSRPHTPDGRDIPRANPSRKSTPAIEVFADNAAGHEFDLDTDSIQHGTPAPPPPPPIPLDAAPADVPRVDYLLQNGGLNDVVTRDFSSAANPSPSQSFQQYMSPQMNAPRHIDVNVVFGPYQQLLQNYSSVLSKYGSMAVATGYKSVARRLLDRLENVFARNISSEICRCVICRSQNLSSGSEHDSGVSWGEVLELVSGRRDLPPWPPFSLAGVSSDGLGIENLENTAAPMQKLDMDVPEEYREHYIRQSKKTKDAVQKWLSSQLPEDNVPAATSSSPPVEVDDGTLTFAMLTYLEPRQRRTFTALLHGLDQIPDSRAPTPAAPSGQKHSSPDILVDSSRALQRLYRLPRAPRDPECTMFLLNNPTLHSPLATLAAISNGEWEILISGRFDGFLWSGAEDGSSPVSSRTPANSASKLNPRSTTPFSPQSSTTLLPTPTLSGSGERIAGPVQLDEDTEIAVLAEVEREIYLGMEALEDAFEALHTQAESVRIRLRERSAGLALRAAQARSADDKGASTIGMPLANGSAWDRLRSVGTGITEDDKADVQSIFGGGLLDGRSELAPDDSASNVGWREREKRRGMKKRRPGGDKGAKERRSERRTPAPVEEVDEEDEVVPRKAPKMGRTTAQDSPQFAERVRVIGDIAKKHRQPGLVRDTLVFARDTLDLQVADTTLQHMRIADLLDINDNLAEIAAAEGKSFHATAEARGTSFPNVVRSEQWFRLKSVLCELEDHASESVEDLLNSKYLLGLGGTGVEALIEHFEAERQAQTPKSNRLVKHSRRTSESEVSKTNYREAAQAKSVAETNGEQVATAPKKKRKRRRSSGAEVGLPFSASNVDEDGDFRAHSSNRKLKRRRLAHHFNQGAHVSQPRNFKKSDHGFESASNNHETFKTNDGTPWQTHVVDVVSSGKYDARRSSNSTHGSATNPTRSSQSQGSRKRRKRKRKSKNNHENGQQQSTPGEVSTPNSSTKSPYYKISAKSLSDRRHSRTCDSESRMSRDRELTQNGTARSRELSASTNPKQESAAKSDDGDFNRRRSLSFVDHEIPETESESDERVPEAVTVNDVKQGASKCIEDKDTLHSAAEVSELVSVDCTSSLNKDSLLHASSNPEEQLSSKSAIADGSASARHSAQLEDFDAASTTDRRHAQLSLPTPQDSPSVEKIKRKSTGLKSSFFKSAPNVKRVQPAPHAQKAISSPVNSPRKPAPGMSVVPMPPLNAKTFGLVQEILSDQPLHLIVATILLNKTTGQAAIPVLWKLLDRYRTAKALASASLDDILEIIGILGLQNNRAKRLIDLGRAWCCDPPTPDRRHRRLHYPKHGDGGDILPDETLGPEEEDSRTGAWEIAHLPGVGAYALDSWRIFCRDRMRGLADDYKGTNARPTNLGTIHRKDGFHNEVAERELEVSFEPEWKRVLPQDKELRAFLRWMWLAEGFDWNPDTGQRRRASHQKLERVNRGAEEVEVTGRAGLMGSVINTNSSHKNSVAEQSSEEASITVPASADLVEHVTSSEGEDKHVGEARSLAHLDTATSQSSTDERRSNHLSSVESNDPGQSGRSGTISTSWSPEISPVQSNTIQSIEAQREHGSAQGSSPRPATVNHGTRASSREDTELHEDSGTGGALNSEAHQVKPRMRTTCIPEDKQHAESYRHHEGQDSHRVDKLIRPIKAPSDSRTVPESMGLVSTSASHPKCDHRAFPITDQGPLSRSQDIELTSQNKRVSKPPNNLLRNMKESNARRGCMFSNSSSNSRSVSPPPQYHDTSHAFTPSTPIRRRASETESYASAASDPYETARSEASGHNGAKNGDASASRKWYDNVSITPSPKAHRTSGGNMFVTPHVVTTKSGVHAGTSVPRTPAPVEDVFSTQLTDPPTSTSAQAPTTVTSRASVFVLPPRPSPRLSSYSNKISRTRDRAKIVDQWEDCEIREESMEPNPGLEHQLGIREAKRLAWSAISSAFSAEEARASSERRGVPDWSMQHDPVPDSGLGLNKDRMQHHAQIANPPATSTNSAGTRTGTDKKTGKLQRIKPLYDVTKVLPSLRKV